MGPALRFGCRVGSGRWNIEESGKFSVFDVALSLDAPPHPLARLGLLHALFLAGLEVDRVLLDLLDDRFLLDLPLEPAQSGFEVFTFVKLYKSQELSPPHWGKVPPIYTGIPL
jgi:hypothetical protein